MGSLLVWVTRAQPGAEVTAGRLLALGHRPLVASLLEVRRLHPPSGPSAETVAIAFTSVNAVTAFAAWTPRRTWPVFTVGDATAAEARAAGFEQVSSASGDVAALAENIAAARPPGVVLHAAAREAAGDLAGALAAYGVRVQITHLYETVTAASLPDAAVEALERKDLDVVLVHSPKAGRVLATLLTGPRAQALSCVRAIGLSRACLTPLAALGFSGVSAASRPDEASLLEPLR